MHKHLTKIIMQSKLGPGCDLEMAVPAPRLVVLEHCSRFCSSEVSALQPKRRPRKPWKRFHRSRPGALGAFRAELVLSFCDVPRRGPNGAVHPDRYEPARGTVALELVDCVFRRLAFLSRHARSLMMPCECRSSCYFTASAPDASGMSCSSFMPYAAPEAGQAKWDVNIVSACCSPGQLQLQTYSTNTSSSFVFGSEVPSLISLCSPSSPTRRKHRPRILQQFYCMELRQLELGLSWRATFGGRRTKSSRSRSGRSSSGGGVVAVAKQ